MSNKTDLSREPGLRIGQVLVTHVEFSHTTPEPLSLKHDTPHNVTALKISVELKVTDDKKKAVLTVRVATDPKNAEALYKLVVEIATLVTTVEGKENMPPTEYLGQVGMSLLYPFLRETIANITTRGRFGPVWLQPINLQLFSQAAPPKTPARAQKAKRTKKAAKKKTTKKAKRIKGR